MKTTLKLVMILAGLFSAAFAQTYSPQKGTLTWTDNSANESGFAIQRAVVANGVNGPFVEIARVTANVTTYIDATLNYGTSYVYQVQAFITKSDGTTQFSTFSNITSPPVTTAPAPLNAPSNAAAILSAPVALWKNVKLGDRIILYATNNPSAVGATWHSAPQFPLLLNQIGVVDVTTVR